MFTPVTSKVDFPAMEREILAWWQQAGIMQKYLRRNRSSGKRYSFIDGPITANNPMGVHHAWGRSYKDLYQRYKTMQGFKQRYQNGFDGQGLWIEVEVEKELGFASKRDIEAYGIDKFVDLCKERVHRFADQITQQSIRLGYWMDWENSYHTMADENNYTIWHFLKVCHDRGWLYEGTDVMPWCPRCGTGLSEHEIVTEGYKEIVHPGLFVRFPLLDRDEEYLLVWTTTPWTLPSNVAVAVHPKLTYIKVQQGEQTLYLAKELLSVLQGDYEVLRELLGQELVGLTYQGPFDELPIQQEVRHRVIPWEEVSEGDGTGIVHIAPGAGKEDFALGKLHSLPTIAPLDEAGVFMDGFSWLTGCGVADVNDLIFNDLRRKGLLYHVENYSHRYPVCWRCDTQLVFRLVEEWFISMDQLRDLIADVTRNIRWIPAFGLERELDWLRNMDDWMISKKRYWGLALPIYKCDCGHFQVIGSETDLQKRAVEGWEQFDGHSPHRPWIDAVKIECPECGRVVSRIKDVGNPWLDAGIVPFSTLGYRSKQDYWSEWFPADWISESFPGQFRNWFYSLLAQSTVLENREPFRAVFSYALMRDEKGAEMHKSKGNAIWFEDAAEEMGVDAMRWVYMRHNPAANLNFGYSIADDARRRFLIPLWNVYSFLVTYANIDGFNPVVESSVENLAELDRWIISELNSLIIAVTRALDDYDAAEAGQRMEEFVGLLSNWYVRRSRRRFWKPASKGAKGAESDQDKLAAYATLYTCLETLVRLMAPFTPFLAEAIYRNLVVSVSDGAPESVHLADWPVANQSAIDRELSEATRLVMQVASLGRAARQKAQVRVRQPLQRVWVTTKNAEEAEILLGSYASQVLDELNVKEIQILQENEIAKFISLKPNLSVLGPKLGDQLPLVTQALQNPSINMIATALAGEALVVGKHKLEPGEVLLETTDVQGYALAHEGPYLVAVETVLTNALQEEGLARELVHRIQTMRRSAGFQITDRIVTWFHGGNALSSVIETHGDYIRQETLSTKLIWGNPGAGCYSEDQRIGHADVTLGVKRVR
ncbi:MAG: isoleucine--tRNA ligase [SAR202 cluster bacterium Io17-Chloro-G3]|nr:MAG: isoleucine--tRNA ligase [SAR202 cluster bacterium Io17-Chloro-G3]